MGRNSGPEAEAQKNHRALGLGDGRPRIAGDGTPPKLIERSHRPPVYPEIARVARVSAIVSLEALIHSDGTVRDVCVQKVSRPGLGFETAATTAVQSWRYEPAMLDGKPIAVRFHVLIQFGLQ